MPKSTMLIAGVFAALIGWLGAVSYGHFQQDEAREARCSQLRKEADDALSNLRLSRIARDGVLITGRLLNESRGAIDGEVFMDAEALDCVAKSCAVMDRASYAVKALRIPRGETRDFHAYPVGSGLRANRPRGEMVLRVSVRRVNWGQAGCF